MMTSRLAKRMALLPVLALTLSACASGEFFEDVQPYGGPDSVIATATDSGTDDDPGLADGDAAVAYDPDGCQVWIIDDGVEGYASPRFDPKTGLPVCDGKYPPGTVLGPYETATAPGPDYIPK
ncbi:MAG: hypothetical protein LPJ95_04510 [Paracoccaceae bacterium]|nr:hypothetical protein [Paracoccaceae bacterium]